MFRLSFDPKHNVLLSSFSGTYGPEDISVRDGAVRRFVARHGPCHGIMDYSAVDQITVPLDMLIRRSHEPPILGGRQRVIVAPNDPALSFNRLVAAHQLYARKEEPIIVSSLRDAYLAIGVSAPHFHPVPEDVAADRERVLHAVLRDIGQATTDPNWESFLLARPNKPAKHIALSDVLNIALGRSALTEADLRAACNRCREAFLLHQAPVLTGRATTYLCPTCRMWMVKVTSLRPADAERAAGYVLGGFEITAQSDLHIAGVRLPRPASE
jgi:hypothetical protein